LLDFVQGTAQKIHLQYLVGQRSLQPVYFLDQFHFPLPSPVLLPRVESIPPAIQSAHIHAQLACHHAHLLAGSDSLHRRSPELFSVFPRSSVVLVHCSSFLLQCAPSHCLSFGVQDTFTVTRPSSNLYYLVNRLPEDERGSKPPGFGVAK